MEIWKNLIGFDLPYQVSNKGNIKCLAYKLVDIFNRVYNKKEHLLHKTLHGSGYYVVTLRKNKRSRVYRLNILIAKTFIDNPNNLPTVDHIDGNKLNNNVTNLRWCTPKENKHNINTFSKSIESSIKSIKSRVKPVYQLDSNYKVIAKYNSAIEAAKEIGCSSCFIQRCCTIPNRTAKGFHWSYSPIGISLSLK